MSDALREKAEMILPKGYIDHSYGLKEKIIIALKEIQAETARDCAKLINIWLKDDNMDVPQLLEEIKQRYNLEG